MSVVPESFVIRLRLIKIGPDQIVLATLIRALLEEKGYKVNLSVVIHGPTGNTIGRYGIDFNRSSDLNTKDFKKLLDSLEAQEIFERPGFRDLRVGSATDTREVLEHLFADASFHAHQACVERKGGKFSGPNTDKFESAVLELMDFVDPAVRERLRRVRRLKHTD